MQLHTLTQDTTVRVDLHALTIDMQLHTLTQDTTVRVGLHAGPVFSGWDPIVNRTIYYGAHVNYAAWIEPATTPGCAFSSQAFAAHLKTAEMHENARDGAACVHTRRFSCEAVGEANFKEAHDFVEGPKSSVLFNIERTSA
jgi:class 3 adenylate cyclase